MFRYRSPGAGPGTGAGIESLVTCLDLYEHAPRVRKIDNLMRGDANRNSYKNEVPRKVFIWHPTAENRLGIQKQIAAVQIKRQKTFVPVQAPTAAVCAGAVKLRTTAVTITIPGHLEMIQQIIKQGQGRKVQKPNKRARSNSHPQSRITGLLPGSCSRSYAFSRLRFAHSCSSAITCHAPPGAISRI